jgi:hypothetical protein
VPSQQTKTARCSRPVHSEKRSASALVSKASRARYRQDRTSRFPGDCFLPRAIACLPPLLLSGNGPRMKSPTDNSQW